MMTIVRMDGTRIGEFASVDVAVKAGVSLAHANLMGVDLFRANISKANLTGTNVMAANLLGLVNIRKD